MFAEDRNRETTIDNYSNCFSYSKFKKEEFKQRPEMFSFPVFLILGGYANLKYFAA